MALAVPDACRCQYSTLPREKEGWEYRSTIHKLSTMAQTAYAAPSHITSSQYWAPRSQNLAA
eukprot:3597547-Rhodomonas_salina.1